MVLLSLGIPFHSRGSRWSPRPIARQEGTPVPQSKKQPSQRAVAPPQRAVAPPQRAVAPRRVAFQDGSVAPLEVICHDSRYAVVAGTLRNISKTECDFVTKDKSDSPTLGLNSKLLMNMFNPASRKCVNVNVRMRDVQREGERWVYRVEWISPPSL